MFVYCLHFTAQKIHPIKLKSVRHRGRERERHTHHLHINTISCPWPIYEQFGNATTPSLNIPNRLSLYSISWSNNITVCKILYDINLLKVSKRFIQKHTRVCLLHCHHNAKNNKSVFRNVLQPAEPKPTDQIYKMLYSGLSGCFFKKSCYNLILASTPPTCKYRCPHVVHSAHVFKYKWEGTR